MILNCPVSLNSFTQNKGKSSSAATSCFNDVSPTPLYLLWIVALEISLEMGAFLAWKYPLACHTMHVHCITFVCIVISLWLLFFLFIFFFFFRGMQWWSMNFFTWTNSEDIFFRLNWACPWKGDCGVLKITFVYTQHLAVYLNIVYFYNAGGYREMEHFLAFTVVVVEGKINVVNDYLFTSHRSHAQFPLP